MYADILDLSLPFWKSDYTFISVRSTLTDMKLAIEGTIVMSDELRVTLDNMYDARLPEKWAKLS